MTPRLKRPKRLGTTALGNYPKLPHIQKEIRLDSKLPEIKRPCFFFGQLRSGKKREARNRNKNLFLLSLPQKVYQINKPHFDLFDCCEV